MKTIRGLEHCLLWGQAVRVGSVQAKQEKTLRRLYNGFTVPESRPTRKLEGDFLQ